MDAEVQQIVIDPIGTKYLFATPQGKWPIHTLPVFIQQSFSCLRRGAFCARVAAARGVALHERARMAQATESDANSKAHQDNFGVERAGLGLVFVGCE